MASQPCHSSFAIQMYSEITTKQNNSQ